MNEINMTREKLSKNILHRLGTFVLALCMTLSLLPAVLPPADAAFSDAAMDKLLNWGVVSGYPDGALHPDWKLTRAEFVAMVNRAYGYSELGNTPFIDVPNNAWFRDDINIAYTANYFSGVSPRMAGPDQNLTREQAMVLLARNMRMEPADGEVIGFSDGRDFSDWSRGYARAAKDAGVIGGYGDGSYKPKNDITRGEMAVMLQRALGTLINKPGTHTLSDVYGNVTISSPNVVLRNSTIAGDLYITGGLSLGDVTLENVRVLGKIVVAGGGESESGESVILRNVQANALIVDSIAGQYVSLASEGDTAIGEAILRTSAYVQDRTRPGGGLLQITLDSLQQGAVFTLSGNLEKVVNKTPGSTLNIAMGTVSVLTIDEKARNSGLHLDINSTVEELNLDTATTVTGVGDIGSLFVNAPGADVEMLPDDVTIRPGLTADIAGQTMNAQQAQESSSDPRLNAGYPKVKNVAPTNANSVYSANKNGTVYWTVSNTADGSIGEEDLVEPTTDNNRIVLSGTTAIEQSSTEYTAALQRLTPDSNYYLTAIMEDARGRRSPIKVISFATPDNTTPAFASGYPTVMKNYSEPIMGPLNPDNPEVIVVQRDEDGNPRRNYRVQIAAMPNKTCVLYYAVYPSGSTAPTAQQFRTGALGTPIRSGVEDATKNRINFIELTGLEELTNYDIYLCYIDADGSRSSAVRKLTFRTVDGKPPRFQYDTPVVTQELLTGLRLNANVNEAATIYWVATRDAEYVKDGDWSDLEWWERACRQIESGTNGIRSGSVTARANADTVINITGLQAATRYYIFFVAKDAAGNYSEFFRAGNPGDDPDIEPPQQYTPHNKQPYKYYLSASTLDNIPPTATQEFTHYDAADPTRPYADTDIRIRFSEAVMQYSTHRTAAADEFRDFYMLYTSHVNARKAYDDAVAAGTTGTALQDLYDAWANSAFVNTLRATIKLYNNAALANESVPERSSPTWREGDDWVIDYRYATVESDADTGEMTVVFSTNPNNPEISAINLSSGATYHFVLDDICDTSSNKNRMGRTQLPDFTTISAQVQLRRANPTWATYQNDIDTTKQQPEEIPIDYAFSLTPISTSVEDDIVWDLLFWVDKSCAFEIYELETNSSGTNARLAHPLADSRITPNTYPSTGHWSVAINVSGTEARDPDPTADNYRGYVGTSYFSEFYGVRNATHSFPSVTGKGNVLADYTSDSDTYRSGVLERNVPKYYGIHFTRIGDVTEEQGRDKTWAAEINVRLSVITASTAGDLAYVAANVTNQRVTESEATGRISIIHTPRPFGDTIPFPNQTAPEFQNGFPRLTIGDTYVDMIVRLNHSTGGTVYYAVAPAITQQEQNGVVTKNYNPLLPADIYNPKTGQGQAVLEPSEKNNKGSDEYERYYTVWNDTASGNIRVNVPWLNNDPNTVPAYDDYTETFDTSVKTSKMELTSPSRDAILDRRYAGTDERIKVGLQQVPSDGPFTIPVTGLMPDTVYFVYLVTQGQSNTAVSERAQIFQFRTEKVFRPVLRVEGGSTSATVTSDRDAWVVGSLFPASLLSGLQPFNQIFYNGTNTQYIDPLLSGEFPTGNDSDGKPYAQYTVLEAILTRNPNGSGSLFDYFANEETKNRVRISIETQNSGSTGNDVIMEGKRANLTAGFDYRDKLDGLAYYTFLVVGMNYDAQNTASGHSLAFSGWTPIRNSSTTKPTIMSISPADDGITVDYQKAVGGTPVLYGSFYLTFTEPLYRYIEPTPSNPSIDTPPLTSATIPTFIQPSSTLFSASAADIDPYNTTDPVRIVKITLRPENQGGVTNGSTFQARMDICTNGGSPRVNMQLEIGIEYDESLRMIRVFVVKDGQVWFPLDGYALFSPEHVKYVTPTSFSFNHTTLNLYPGETSQVITVTLRPNGARAEVELYWAGDTLGNISMQSETTFTVTANTTITERSTSKIRARLYDLDTGNEIIIANPPEIEVIVTPTYLGSVVASPARVELVWGGSPARIELSVTAPISMSAPDQRLLTTPVTDAAVAEWLDTSQITYHPNNNTATLLLALKKEPTTQMLIFLRYAAQSNLIMPCEIEVSIRPGS